MDGRRKERIISMAFILYIILLVRLIVFKYPLPMMREILRNNSLENFNFRLKHSNWVVFKGIYGFLFKADNWTLALKNIGGNILAFMPLGFFLSYRWKLPKGFKKSFYLGLALSLLFESIQLLTGLGEFDLDDILLNTLGALMGAKLYGIILG